METRFIIAFAIGVFLSGHLYAVECTECYRSSQFLVQRQSVEQSGLPDVFRAIESAIRDRSVEKIGAWMAPILRINVYMDENVMSEGQAQAVLNIFFSNRRVTSFFFSTINTTSTVPYGIGQMMYVEKGLVRYAQVYVALTSEDSNWRIMQLSIYE